ncbi:MAG: hypothetical protein QXV22_00645 [Thermoplasmataceae archaeon]
MYSSLSKQAIPITKVIVENTLNILAINPVVAAMRLREAAITLGSLAPALALFDPASVSVKTSHRLS